MTYPALVKTRAIHGQKEQSQPREVVLMELLDLARWAPSGDNCQPWRVRRAPGGLQIGLHDAPLGFLDQGPATAIALGSFVESCRIAAEQLGTPAAVHFEAAEKPRAFVSLGKEGGRSPLNGALGGLLPMRCSNRRLYAPGSCRADELRQLEAELSGLGDVQLSFATEGQLSQLARAVAVTEKVRLRHRLCHQDFHAKVRWTAEEAEADPTGFWVDTFEIKSHERWMLRVTRRWSIARAVDVFLRVGDIAAKVAAKQVRHAGAVAFFTVSEQNADSWFAVGRALQRVWLRATALGLSGQVLGVAPIFLHKLREGGEGFTPRQREQIRRAGERLEAVEQGPRADELVLMLRLGRAASPTARAGRLPAAALIEGEELLA